MLTTRARLVLIMGSIAISAVGSPKRKLAITRCYRAAPPESSTLLFRAHSLLLPALGIDPRNQ